MKHVFTEDWFSAHVPKFESYLAPLRGKDCSLLEIGCYEGKASTWLLENIATDENAKLLCIDVRENKNFWNNIRSSHGEARTELKIGFSRDVLKTLQPSSYDFIYIDGSHWTSQVFTDAILSFRLAKTGAVIAFDDYLWDDPGFNKRGTPKAAIDAFTNIYRDRLEILEYGWQVWLRKTKDGEDAVHVLKRKCQSILFMLSAAYAGWRAKRAP